MKGLGHIVTAMLLVSLCACSTEPIVHDVYTFRHRFLYGFAQNSK